MENEIRQSLSRTQSAFWPGRLAALPSHGRGVIPLGAFGFMIVCASPIAAALTPSLMTWGSGRPAYWTDVVAGFVRILMFGGLVFGLPGWLALSVLLWAFDRTGPRYWPRISRARWLIVVAAPATAALPAVALSALASIALVCAPGGPGATVASWMRSDVAYWIALAGLPAGYLVAFSLGICRAWREATAP